MAGAPTLEVLPDAAAVARRAAELFLRDGRDAVGARGSFAVTLSGGSTPRALYLLLADEPYVSSVPWSRVRVFWGDERCVAPGDAASNYRLAQETFLNTVPLPPTRVHRLRGEAADPEQAAREYEALLRAQAREAGTVPGGVPRMDLILLGMGADGHTASLFPYRQTLRETRRLVVVDDIPGVGRRLTVTLPLLKSARHIVFAAVGQEKAAAVAEVLQGPWDPRRLPAQGVVPRFGRLTWLIDRAAAECLRSRV